MNYIKIMLDDQRLDYDAKDLDFPISFSYELEDDKDFQQKKSSTSLGLKLPSTLNNQKQLNTMHNTLIADNKNYFGSIKSFSAEVNGLEIFKGLAIPKRAIKKNNIPISYELDVFGNNGDWIIQLKDLNFYDILKHINFELSDEVIRESWAFDGRNENIPYVFAPVKYAGWMDPENNTDKNYSLEAMKPSLSIYYILYWGF